MGRETCWALQSYCGHPMSRITCRRETHGWLSKGLLKPFVNKLNWDNFSFPKALRVSPKNSVIIRQTGSETLKEKKYANIQCMKIVFSMFISFRAI